MAQSLPQCWQVSCPIPLLSCLISSNLPLVSSPLVPSPFIPPLYRSQMSLLCTAVWHLQSDSFTPLMSPQGYYIPSQSSAHTHPTMETHFHSAFVMSVSRQKKAGLSKPIQPRWWNSSGWVIQQCPFFFLFFLLFGMEDFTSSWQIWNNISYNTKRIYLHLHRKMKQRKHIFVPSTD